MGRNNYDSKTDSTHTFQTGHLTFPILCELIEDSVLTISNDEMKSAMKVVAERMKLVIEASAGASVAAALYKVYMEKIAFGNKV